MKLHILADLHLEFGDFRLPDTDADVLVLAGDIHTKERSIPWLLEQAAGKPVIYVLGNHEYYGKAYPKLLNTMRKETTGTNIHILENGSIEIDGVTFLGCTLWTDFKLMGNPMLAAYEAKQIVTDFRRIRVSPRYSKLTPGDVVSIHRNSLNWLKSSVERSDHKAVIVTHHAPSLRSVPDCFKADIVTAAFASDLDGFVEESGAKLWIHGHMHASSDYLIGKTRVICNPRGYAPDDFNPEFNPELVVEV